MKEDMAEIVYKTKLVGHCPNCGVELTQPESITRKTETELNLIKPIFDSNRKLNSRSWTPEKDAEVLRLERAGNDAKRISQLLNRTYDSIKTRLWLLHGGKRKEDVVERFEANSKNQAWATRERDFLKKSFREGKEYSVIGNALGRSSVACMNMVCLLRKKGELPKVGASVRNNTAYTQEEKSKILNEALNERNYKRIAVELNRTIAAIRVQACKLLQHYNKNRGLPAFGSPAGGN